MMLKKIFKKELKNDFHIIFTERKRHEKIDTYHIVNMFFKSLFYLEFVLYLFQR